MNGDLIVATTLSDFSTSLSDARPLIGILGSARIPESSPLYALCRRTAYALASQGYSIVTGGGTGLMAAANQGALNAIHASYNTAQSVGILINNEPDDCVNHYQTKTFIVPDVAQRKDAFARLCNGIVAFPGGLGTLDEVATIALTRQISQAVMPPTVLIDSRFWSPFLKWVDGAMLKDGLVNPSDKEGFYMTDVADALPQLFKKWFSQNNQSML